MNDWYKKLAELEKSINDERVLQWMALICMTLTFAIMFILLI